MFMDNKKKMPMYGVGPMYVITIIIITILGICLDQFNLLDSLKFEVLRLPFFIIGVLLIIYGIILWLLAVFNSRIDKNIEANTLVTTGVYSYTRNPIYVAFIFMLTGIVLWFFNLYLLILPIIYYVLLTILMIKTEEVWLLEVFGNEYIEYCKRTNRIIPWFPKKIVS